GGIQLREIAGIDQDLEFAERRHAEAELAAQKAPAFDLAARFQRAEPCVERGDELAVADAGLQVAGDLVDIHCATPPQHARMTRGLSGKRRWNEQRRGLP